MTRNSGINKHQLCVLFQALGRHTYKLNDKSLERTKSCAINTVLSTATTTNDCKPFHNFRKILFYNEFFLFHAKLINSLINLHKVPYGVQIGLLPITLSF